MCGFIIDGKNKLSEVDNNYAGAAHKVVVPEFDYTGVVFEGVPCFLFVYRNADEKIVAQVTIADDQTLSDALMTLDAWEPFSEQHMIRGFYNPRPA